MLVLGCSLRKHLLHASLRQNTKFPRHLSLNLCCTLSPHHMFVLFRPQIQFQTLLHYLTTHSPISGWQLHHHYHHVLHVALYPEMNGIPALSDLLYQQTVELFCGQLHIPNVPSHSLIVRFPLVFNKRFSTICSLLPPMELGSHMVLVYCVLRNSVIVTDFWESPNASISHSSLCIYSRCYWDLYWWMHPKLVEWSTIMAFIQSCWVAWEGFLGPFIAKNSG